MADPGRPGQRGAYRLGKLRVASARAASARAASARAASARADGRAPREPSFGLRRSRVSVAWWLAGCAVAAVILGFGAALGLWFLPFMVGIAAGAAPWRARSAAGLVVLAVAVGWGAALWWPALSGAPAGATARVIAALAGLPPHAAVGVAATLLIGILPALTAVWLTRAITRWSH